MPIQRADIGQADRGGVRQLLIDGRRELIRLGPAEIQPDALERRAGG
jgi:hypothetical protein